MGAKKGGKSGDELPPHVSRIGQANTLTYKRRWPNDVRQRQPDLGEFFQRSLKTTDARAAWVAYSRVDQEFRRRCEEYTAATPVETSESWLRSLTPEQRAKVLEIADGQTAKTFGPSEDAEEALARLSIEFFQSEWATINPPPLTPLLASKLPPDSQARIRDTIRAEVSRATGEAATALLGLGYPAEELPPSVREGARALAKAGKPAEPLTAEKLLAAWEAEARPAKSTLKKYRGVFRRLSLFLGFDDVWRITAEDVARFKPARLEAGISPGTVADDVLAAGAVCSWAAKNRLLPANPFVGLAPRAARRGPEPRAPYDNAEAKTILKAARTELGWLRWLPWVLAFTGARISELVELKRGDVRQEAGVWIFDIRPHEGRQGKNATFQRMLPVHPALEAEGFLDYVATLPADPKGPLFPTIPPDPAGSRVSPATTRHGEWMREKVGIKDPQKAPAHSWRHRMEDSLRKARVPEEVVDAITGRHNPRNAGADYGWGFRRMPAEVLKELAKVPSPVPAIEPHT